MPKRKRSLHPGNKDSKQVEQLHDAIEMMLSGADSKIVRVEASIEPLVRIAADLRDLPRDSFKIRLKSEFGGRKRMPTVIQPVAAVRTTASPRLAFRDPAKAIEFYKRALGAKETFRFEVGGQIPHAVIMIGDSAINLAGEWPEGGRFSAETLGHSPVSMSVRVNDVDAFAEHAVGAGMKLVRAARDQFYGQRDALLEDPFGYSWSVFAVKEEMSIEEMHRRMKGETEGPEGGKMPEKKAVISVPTGFRTVTPYLIAQDAPALVEFAKQAFAAGVKFQSIGSAGGLHAEVRIGDSLLMIGGGIPGQEFRATPTTHALHIYVENADDVYQKALAAGATSIDEPRDQEYGERSAGVKDPAGNYWYIATHQGESHIPEGLHSVNPYLHPLRAEPLMSFLKRAFGAHEIAKYASPDGVVHHAAIRVGDSVIEMGEAHGKYEPMSATFYLYVPNVDAVYRQALAGGATSFQEPADQVYGDRNAGVEDSFGNKWYIASRINNVAP